MQKTKLDEVQSVENTDKILNGVTAVLDSLHAKQKWPDKHLLKHAIDQSTVTLDEHLADLSRSAAVLVQKDGQPDEMAKDVETLYKQWNIDKNPPSLLSMCLFLIENMSIKPDKDDIGMVMMSAMLGQVQNDTPYHSDMHFRKVLSQTMRMIAAHNNIFGGTDRELNVKQICRLISAACIHDLGHDGQGNVIKGIHIEGRAERYSFGLAEPYLKAIGCDKETLNALLTMILTTDVAPLNDPANPMMQMKAAYRYHFMGENKSTHTLNLSKNLKVLEKDAELATMCLILHEADIATSAAITYEITKYETALLMEEYREEPAYPDQVIDFLNQICQRRFLSDVGQKLYAANMGRIYALAEKDMKDGNDAYPLAVHADFNVSLSKTSDGKTIN